MDLTPFIAALAASGYSGLVPYLVGAFFSASIGQAVIRPPAPGSHWLPAYRLMALLAANFGYAKNSNVPALSTWAGRVLAPLAPAIIAAVEAQNAAKVAPSAAGNPMPPN